MPPTKHSRPNRITGQMAMQVLGDLMRASWHPSLKDAKPIVFDFVLEQWSFDPSHPQTPVRQGSIDHAALRVRCAPETLFRLLTEKGFAPDPYEIFVDGDTKAVAPLIQALGSGQSGLSLRAAQQDGRVR